MDKAIKKTDSLISPRLLFNESKTLFYSKIKPMLFFMFMPFLTYFLCERLFIAVTFSSTYYSSLYPLINFSLWAIPLVTWWLTIPAIFISLKEDFGIRESLKRSFKLLPSYIWLNLLLVAITAGSFLLFIIPGLFFSFFASLTIPLFILEKKRGFKALLGSRLLISGFRENIFFHLFLIVTTITYLLLSLMFIFSTFDLFTFEITFFIFLIVFPLILTYLFVFYKKLTSLKIEPQKNKRKWIKRVSLLPGMLILPTLFLPLVFFLLNIITGGNIPPIDDKDLTLPPFKITRGENAYHYLYKAKKAFKLTIGKKDYSEYLSYTDSSYSNKKVRPKIDKKLIKQNRIALDYLNKAINCSFYQRPQLQKIIGYGKMKRSKLSIFSIKDLAHFLIFQARQFLRTGQQEKAINTDIKVLKLANLLQRAQHPNLTDFMVGQSLKSNAIRKIKKMLLGGQLSSKKLRTYYSILDQYRTKSEDLIRTLKLEYTLFKLSIPSLNPKDNINFLKLLSQLNQDSMIPLSRITAAIFYYYKQNKTTKTIATYYRFIIDKLKTNSQLIKSDFESYKNYLGLGLFFTENIVGKLLINIVKINYPRSIVSVNSQSDIFDMNQLLLLLKAYKLDKGYLPKTLSKLIPSYTLAIPLTMTSKLPISYSRKEKLLYIKTNHLSSTKVNRTNDIVTTIEF